MFKQTILIIEDNKDLGEILIRFLQASGYRTHWLKCGSEVMEYINHTMPALILMDMMIPQVDGITLTTQIRQLSDVPIIMLTAKTDYISRMDGLTSGIDEFVCKPFSGNDLIVLIKQILK